MLPLAKRYLDGLGTERNVEEAQRILSHAASIGDAEAYIMLGDILLADPDRDERALHQAIECYERSARHGNPRAFEILADLYHSKDFPERNVAYAYELYVLAAEAGISTAAEKARSIRTSREEYFENARRLIKTDPATAFRYLVIADAMGHEEAALTLGGCFEIGLGTKKNRRAAFEYYEKAAKNKVKGAHFRLGRCYAFGIGTAFSFDLAVRHLKIADRQSDKRAHGELEALLLKKKKSLVNKLYSTAMRLIYKKKFSEALKLLSAASDEGHARASYALGCLYEFGKGTKQNRRYASELYAKAEAQQAPRAREHYKITILRMIK
jgi:TPR repeat protein